MYATQWIKQNKMLKDSISSKRVAWIDWAKTILIALVCVGHFNSPEVQKLLIWGCHMPAFFMISGYLYHRHGVWRTLFSFIIPMLFYTSIVFGVHIIQDIVQNGYWDYKLDFGHFWHRVLEQYILRNAGNPYGIIPVIGVWFVVALIVSRLLSGDIKCFSFTLRFKYITLAVLLVWLSVEPLIWDYIPIKDVKLYYGIYAMPFFIIGYMLKDFELDIHRINPVIIFICLAIYIFISLNFPRFDMMNYQCGPTYMVFFINAICGSLVLFWFCTWLPQNKVVEVFSIGTLMILTLHMPFDFFILPVFHRVGLTPAHNIFMEYFIPWLEAAIVLLITYHPILLLNKHCPILLGKVKSISSKE